MAWRGIRTYRHPNDQQATDGQATLTLRYASDDGRHLVTDELDQAQLLEALHQDEEAGKEDQGRELDLLEHLLDLANARHDEMHHGTDDGDPGERELDLLLDPRMQEEHDDDAREHGERADEQRTIMDLVL